MSHRKRHPSPAPFWLSSLLFWACGDDGGSHTDGPRVDAALTASSVGTGAGLDAGPSCSDGTVQACACPEGGEGERRCRNGVLGASCEGCGPAVVADTTTKCIAGRYVGMLDVPYYVPGPAGFCGLITLFGGGGAGEMAFTLGASDNSEFATVIGSASCLDLALVSDAGTNPAVSDAGVEELPDGGGLRRRLSMELSGSVDCRSGKFTGEVKGTYRSVSFCDLGQMENDYFMKGPVTAMFDPRKRAFVDGVLDLKEPPVAFAFAGEAGGKGTWTAKLERDAGTPPAPAQGCLGGVQFRDDLFP